MPNENLYQCLAMVEVTPSDFNDTLLESTIENSKRRDCSYYHECLTQRAMGLFESGRLAESKAIFLIACACSMMLEPRKRNDPFKPGIVWDGKRSAIPSDFTDSDLTFLSSIIPCISDFCVRARIADICWHMGRPRNPELALAAIEAYIQHPLLDNEHYSMSKKPWQRAIYLCRLFQKISRIKMNDIFQVLMTALMALDETNKMACSILSDLLLETGISVENEQIIQRILDLSQGLKWDTERTLLEHAIRWITRTNKNDCRVWDIYARIAESHVDQAKCATSGLSSSWEYEFAVKYYRMIPRVFRESLKVDKKIAELLQLLSCSNEVSISEMTSVKSPTVNITDIVNSSKEYVSGRTFPDVLIAFISITTPTKVDKLRKEVIKDLKSSPFRAMISVSHMRDTRVVKKSHGIDILDLDSQKSQDRIYDEMIQRFYYNASFWTSSAIVPALETISMEHRIDVLDIETCIKSCRLINPNRLSMWAKSLFLGFELDFVTAIHLLAPLVENMVREIFKFQGISTTTIGDDSVETENGLGSLLDNPKASEVIDDDLLFELKAIFTEPLGFNLRNNVAHGLFCDDINYSVSAVYTWWFCLRLVLSNTPNQVVVKRANKITKKRRARLKRNKDTKKYDTQMRPTIINESTV